MVKTNWATFVIILKGPFSDKLINMKHIQEHSGNATSSLIVSNMI